MAKIGSRQRKRYENERNGAKKMAALETRNVKWRCENEMRKISI
jgi:hypothetical protein